MVSNTSVTREGVTEGTDWGQLTAGCLDNYTHLGSGIGYSVDLCQIYP